MCRFQSFFAFLLPISTACLVPQAYAGENENTVLPQHFVEQVEKNLREQYGETEVNYFREMINAFDTLDDKLSPEDENHLESTLTQHIGGNFYRDYKRLENVPPASDDEKLVQTVLKMIRQQFNKLREVENAYVTPNMQKFVEIKEASKLLPTITGDVPCKTPASCKKLEHLMNMCNYARKGALFGSNIFNTMTHVVNSMISLMCACLFVGPVHVCVLKNFPYTCKIPFPVYSSLYMATTQVWEVVQATTKLCNVYGDPGIGSLVS